MDKCIHCGISELETSRFINGMCWKHYQQVRKYGEVRRTIYDPNEFIVNDDNTIEIKLYDKYGSYKSSSIIDVDFLELVKKYKWYEKNGYVRGAKACDNNKIFLHRLITNCPNNMVIDHINKDTLDNRLSNLRICTQKDNARNRDYIKSNKHVGVKLVASGNYQACITVNYKTIYLGTFSEFECAVQARLDAEIKYFGEYSRSNYLVSTDSQPGK
jgi:hypothetical protein